MKRSAVVLATMLPVLAAAEPPAPPAPLAPADLVRAMGIEPGQWQGEARIVDTDLESTAGAPPPSDARERARATIGVTQHIENCVGASPGAEGTLVLPGISLAPLCRYSTLTAADGSLRLVANCDRPDLGNRLQIFVDATYGPASIAGTITSVSSTPATSGWAVRTVVGFTMRRTDVCPLGG